jgi:hypothetical protein
MRANSPPPRIDWLGGTPGGQVRSTWPPDEVVERFREAVSGAFQPVRGTSDGLSFRLWVRSRALDWQVPRLEARVEARGGGSVVHYRVVGPVMAVVWPLVIVAFCLCGAVVNSIASQELSSLWLGVPVALLLGGLALLLTAVFNRGACRTLLRFFHRMLDDGRRPGA